jgi:hypothetical protein
MIDIFVEDLMTFGAACREKVFCNPKTGKPAHISSIYRYALRGGRSSDGSRVQLETIKTPSGLRTSKQAIHRFVAAMSGSTAVETMSNDRTREIGQAESDLREDGFDIGG